MMSSNDEPRISSNDEPRILSDKITFTEAEERRCQNPGQLPLQQCQGNCHLIKLRSNPPPQYSYPPPPPPPPKHLYPPPPIASYHQPPTALSWLPLPLQYPPQYLASNQTIIIANTIRQRNLVRHPMQI